MARGDRDVEAALRDGNKARALMLLMRRYGDLVYRAALAMLHDHDLAEDVRQQVFIEVYRDLDTFAGRSTVRGWLFGIVRHRCLDAARQQQRWICRFKNEAVEDEEPCDGEPGRDIERSRAIRLLAQSLATLAPSAREAVVMRYYQGLSYNEASQISGDLCGTLQKRVTRALAVLRRCLEAQACGPSRMGRAAGTP